MPNLLSVRFSKVGYSDARIDGLGYSLARDGEAKNSLVLTGNGGGKTTQVHLLFSLFLPQRRELMSYQDNTGRRFEYYFEENEIAFIASEWSIPNSQIPLGGRQRTRVIGRFTQFTNREKYEYETYFFSFIADDELGIDDLPITSSIPHRVKAYCRTISEAKKYLKETFGKQPWREFFGPTDKMEYWQNYLRSLGFNIDIFRLMQMFTMSEGDPGAFLKRYCSQEAVLGMITKEVMDSNSTARLRDMLVQHRDSISLAPMTRAQITAYNALSELFSKMEPVAAKLMVADQAFAKAVAELGTVAARINATLAVESQKVADLSQIQAADKAILAAEKKNLGEMQAELRGVIERLASLASQAARAQYQEITEQLGKKSALVTAMRAVVDQVEVMNAKTTRDDLSRRLDALAEPTRNLADELAMAEQLLAEYLVQDLNAASTAVKKLEADEREAVEARKGLVNEKQELLAELAGQKKEQAMLQGVEDERARSLAAIPWHESGLQDGTQVQPRLAALEAESADLKGRLVSAQNEQADLKAELVSVEHRLKDHNEKLEALGKERGKAWAAFEDFQKRYASVAEMPGIKGLFQLDTPNLFLTGLDSRLKGSVASCEIDIRKLECDIASREERIQAIEKNGGLLPSSMDVETVLDALRSAKLDAHSYWQVFSQQNRAPEEAVRELGKDPFRVGGVAVSGPVALEKAREILAACNVLAPVAVSDYSVAIKSREESGFVVFPDAALAIDRKEAERFCTTARGEIGSMEAKIAIIKTARDAAAESRDALVSFLGGYNESSEALFKGDLVRLDNAIQACSSEIGTLTEKHAAVLELLAQVKNTCDMLADAIRKLEPLIQQVSKHIARYEQGRDDRLRRMQQLSLANSSTGRAVELLEERILVSEGVEREARDAAEKGRALASGITSELNKLGGIRKAPTDIFRTLATNTASARELHSGKSRALESANANEEYLRMQAMFDAAQKTYEERQRSWDRRHGGLTADALSNARWQVASTVATEDDYQRAVQEKNEAYESQVTAKQARDTLAKEEESHKKAHFNLPVIPCSLEQVEGRTREAWLSTAIEELTAAVAARSEAVANRAADLASAEYQVQLLSTLASDLQVADEVCAPYANFQEAQQDLAAAKKAEKLASTERDSLGRDLGALNIDLAELLDQDLCAPIASMGSLIKEEQRRSGGVLKEDVTGFLDRIHNAIESLKFELSQHERNEQKVVEQVVLDVKKAFGYLSKLATRSKVPALGGIWAEWSGKPFIQFRTRIEIDSDTSRQAIADTVTMISQIPGVLPAGDEIIHTALSAVLGKAYIIETLKPDTSPTTVYKGIEHPTGLNAWSGGERLSGAVLFYLAICNLLSVDGQGGNVMLLDNPFGSCTNIDFIRLVIALTRQYGVQIVACTPTENEDIRRLFPLNIMIRKGGTDGIIKSTGKPIVRYEKTVYNEGEIATLEISREVPHATS
ncbi:coiled-coil domain-containing protein [Geotalea uraniireducens]|uniref:Chromosome segregation ATPase-like protein n=1 Tax=Geotalea uraniireducens (strain Rf4) TaxID=351605 RepID=A5GB25_GEOUR|nr:chromosome segregation ATPase-like protein [Geotalea uraniireducens]ABQ25219.1 Chromosome segregation ATPase-like protein [Geotalea uraniireducens Rf4]